MSRDVPATGAAKRGARAQAQRDRILDAAQRCFAERGFHGASMAMIAEAAQMSPGLIYRYFAGKSELIHGIVSRQVELLADDFEEMESGARDPVDTIVDNYCACMADADDAGAAPHDALLDATLILEIVAESSRDPVIAEALNLLDQRIDVGLGSWLARPDAAGGQGTPAALLPARKLILRALLDGLKMRQVRDPDLDPALLREALQDALPRLREA
ncbi:MAG: TetR/AcrR family transcriptional regulator [Xanthomonadaceae bacterium]|nr:TetR/AcrR family transcriptional regulator [Xanthomonadaceae bacterium]